MTFYTLVFLLVISAAAKCFGTTTSSYGGLPQNLAGKAPSSYYSSLTQEKKNSSDYSGLPSAIGIKSKGYGAFKTNFSDTSDSNILVDKTNQQKVDSKERSQSSYGAFSDNENLRDINVENKENINISNVPSLYINSKSDQKMHIHAKGDLNFSKNSAVIRPNSLKYSPSVKEMLGQMEKERSGIAKIFLGPTGGICSKTSLSQAQQYWSQIKSFCRISTKNADFLSDIDQVDRQIQSLKGQLKLDEYTLNFMSQLNDILTFDKKNMLTSEKVEIIDKNINILDQSISKVNESTNNSSSLKGSSSIDLKKRKYLYLKAKKIILESAEETTAIDLLEEKIKAYETSKKNKEFSNKFNPNKINYVFQDLTDMCAPFAQGQFKKAYITINMRNGKVFAHTKEVLSDLSNYNNELNITSMTNLGGDLGEIEGIANTSYVVASPPILNGGKVLKEGVIETFGTLYINGTFKGQKNIPVSNEAKVLMAQRLLNAIGGLHNKGYVHRDLKPDNFLVKDVDNGHADITDLGLAVNKEDLNQGKFSVTNYALNPFAVLNYMKNGKLYDSFEQAKKIDLFNLGHVLIDILGPPRNKIFQGYMKSLQELQNMSRVAFDSLKKNQEDLEAFKKNKTPSNKTRSEAAIKSNNLIKNEMEKAKAKLEKSYEDLSKSNTFAPDELENGIFKMINPASIMDARESALSTDDIVGNLKTGLTRNKDI